MALSLLLLLAAQADVPSLTLSADGFNASALGKNAREPFVVTSDRSSDHVMYRKDDAYAVWDARGLTVRHGSFILSSRLPELAVTPKLFPREEILETVDLIAKKDRTREATALSGSRRLGDEVFFLVRWDDKAGKPWLEALVKVNLTQAKPKPELVGKFDGRSLATGTMDDKLVLLGTSPSIFASTGDGGWGVASYNRLQKEFGYKPLGTGLFDAVSLSPRLALVMEKTDYGKVRVARVDLTTGFRRDLAELSGTPTFLDGQVPPLVIVPTNLGPALRNLETGVQMNLPEKAIVRRTAAGIIVWPEGRPEMGALYSPERFLKLAAVSSASVKGAPKQATPDPKAQTPVKKTPPPA